jgi:hypothetical protein
VIKHIFIFLTLIVTTACAQADDPAMVSKKNMIKKYGFDWYAEHSKRKCIVVTPKLVSKIKSCQKGLEGSNAIAECTVSDDSSYLIFSTSKLCKAAKDEMEANGEN